MIGDGTKIWVFVGKLYGEKCVFQLGGVFPKESLISIIESNMG
jgi:hypothetical protein